jgi:hypothetical protein
MENRGSTVVAVAVIGVAILVAIVAWSVLLGVVHT